MSEDQNWENGSFDEFIRRSVEDPQLEFDPKAWEAMEEKLDARAGGTGHAGNVGKIGGGLLALLLISLLGWFLLNGSEENTIAAERQESQQLSDPVSAKNDISADLQYQQIDSQTEEKTGHASAISGSTVEAGNSAEASGKKKRLSSSGNNEEDPEEHPAATTDAIAGRSSSFARPDDTYRGKAGAPRALNNRVFNTNIIGNDDNEPMGALAEDEVAKELLLQKLPWQAFVFDKVEVIPVRQGEPAAGKEQEEDIVPARPDDLPLSLILSVAPDFSGTGESASTRLGAGAGIHLEYRILPRLGLVTGLVYSQKNYLANSSYSPYDFGYYRPKPDHIDASCGVLDLPINLRYYFSQGRRHSFFLSSGLSSYLMKSEDYTMVYSDERYEDFTYEVRGENRHYFAVYNFSAGYEVRISPRWSLQGEPFLKIPAKGIGAGEIRLNSMGAFVHLKYQIGRAGN